MQNGGPVSARGTLPHPSHTAAREPTACRRRIAHATMEITRDGNPPGPLSLVRAARNTVSTEIRRRRRIPHGNTKPRHVAFSHPRQGSQYWVPIHYLVRAFLLSFPDLPTICVAVEEVMLQAPRSAVPAAVSNADLECEAAIAENENSPLCGETTRRRVARRSPALAVVAIVEQVAEERPAGAQ